MGKTTQSTQKAGPKSSHDGTTNTREQRKGRGERTTGNQAAAAAAAAKTTRRPSESAAASSLKTPKTHAGPQLLAAFDRKIRADHPGMSDEEVAAVAARQLASLPKRGGRSRRSRRTRSKRSKRSGSKRSGSKRSGSKRSGSKRSGSKRRVRRR